MPYEPKAHTAPATDTHPVASDADCRQSSVPARQAALMAATPIEARQMRELSSVGGML